MPKYLVTMVVDASKTVEVEAGDKEEAEKKAWELVRQPHICNQCSHELDIGDFTGDVAVDEA